MQTSTTVIRGEHLILDRTFHSAAWGPIAAGAVGGFATAVLLATLGMALGLSIGAGVDDADPQAAAAGIGAGAVAWILLSAAIVGLVAGALLAATARDDRPFWSCAWGTVTWAAGLTLAVLIGGLAGSASLTGMAGAAAALTGSEASYLERDLGPAGTDGTNGSPQYAARPSVDAEDALDAAAGAAWAVIIAQLVGLGVTIAAARAIRRRMMDRAPELAPAT